MTVTTSLLWPFFAALFGAVFGSFFTVVIYRVPLELSIVRPGSFCPSCNSSIRWHDNLPIIGWLLLRGKCRSCKSSIPIRYPLLELSCAVALGAVAYLGMPPGLPVALERVEWTLQLLLLVWAAFPIVITDLRSMLIPDVIVFPSIVLALLIALVPGGVVPSESLFAAVVLFAALWLFVKIASKLLKREAMGFGDLKLVAFFGAVMGLQKGVLAIVIGAFLGLLVMVPLQQLGKHSRGGELPFGPFLYAGAFVSWFWGESIWSWYLSSLGVS